MENNEKNIIKVGDNVIWIGDESRGVGRCTFASRERDMAFIVWGDFGDMINRSDRKSVV